MAFLFSPKVRSFSDETLESYLLRVVAENFFSSYEELSFAIREELHELDFEAHGAFPIDLKRLNIYHAKHNSHFRMRALGLLETLLDLPRFELQKLALLKSDRKFNSLSALHRDGVDIPLNFIRYDGEDGKSSIPVCPECLAEASYIRQSWHLKWVNNCAKHKCKLIHHCPECNSPINYIENESITHCGCGFELLSASSHPAQEDDVKFSQYLMSEKSPSKNILFDNTSISERFSALLWYQTRYSSYEKFESNEIVHFFSKWPDNFFHELDQLSENAEMKLINLFNKTEFRYIFKDLILSVPYSRYSDGEHHFIRKALINYLTTLVQKNPKSKKANIADMLLSVSEVSILLGTSHEQIYRLHQDGILLNSKRNKMHRRIDPHTGIFFLRQVMEYKTSFGGDNPKMYVSAW